MGVSHFCLKNICIYKKYCIYHSGIQLEPMLNKMSVLKYISLEVVSASDSNGDSDSDSGGNPGGNSGKEAPDPAA